MLFILGKAKTRKRGDSPETGGGQKQMDYKSKI